MPSLPVGTPRGSFDAQRPAGFYDPASRSPGRDSVDAQRSSSVYASRSSGRDSVDVPARSSTFYATAVWLYN